MFTNRLFWGFVFGLCVTCRVYAGSPCTTDADCTFINCTTGANLCISGACTMVPAGDPLICRDAYSCTVDSCDTTGGDAGTCDHFINDTAHDRCGDGLRCNGQEQCDPTAANADSDGCRPDNDTTPADCDSDEFCCEEDSTDPQGNRDCCGLDRVCDADGCRRCETDDECIYGEACTIGRCVLSTVASGDELICEYVSGCGNGVCDPACENCSTCPEDCACASCTEVCNMGMCESACGNGTCDSACEDCESCPDDCACQLCTETCVGGACQPACGDGTCDPTCGENCDNCVDCACGPCNSCVNDVCEPDCGNGMCDPACEDCNSCPADCGCTSCTQVCDMGVCVSTCGDSICDTNCEDCDNCPDDCGCDPCTQICSTGPTAAVPSCVTTCGDAFCDTDCENCSTCPADCACTPCTQICDMGMCESTCGNGICDPACEDCENCPDDCACVPCAESCVTVTVAAVGASCVPACGDGSCDPNCGENCTICPSDCACVMCTETCVAGSCDPACGDGFCDDACDEDCTTCPADCACTPCTEVCDMGVCGLACGDGICDPACEDCDNCSADCACNPCQVCNTGVCELNCDDGLACNGLETCDLVNGCLPGIAPNCSDHIGCTTDTCEECDPTDTACLAVGYECVHTPNHAFCQNGLGCDGAETCVAGTVASSGCQPGTAPDCNDGIDCTVDMCMECDPTDTACLEVGYKCVHTPNHDSCQNGLRCDGLEVCNPNATPGTGCEDGPDPVCNDSIGCTINSCEECDPTDTICLEELGYRCVFRPDDTFCDDGLGCNGEERCVVAAVASTGCVPGTPPVCNDHIGCTINSCMECAAGDTACIEGDGYKCVFTPDNTFCDDGLGCNGEETCLAGNVAISGCQLGTAPVCDDGLTCTTDTCAECDAGDTACEQGLGYKCMFTPNHAVCQNSLACDGAEICNPAATGPGTGCEDGPNPVCDDMIDCTVDTCAECDPATMCLGHLCVFTPDHTECDDGLGCNGVETCQVGTVAGAPGCVDGTPPVCDDRIDCTTDTCMECAAGDTACEEVGYKCVFTANHGFCDDDLGCNGVEVCNAGATAPSRGCEDGPDPVCNDSIGCTINSCENCDPTTDAMCLPAKYKCVFTPNDAYCDNGLACDGEETCLGGNVAVSGCVPGTPPVCDDSIPCTINSCMECDPATMGCNAQGYKCVFTPDPTFCGNGTCESACENCVTCPADCGCQPAEPPCEAGEMCNASGVCVELADPPPGTPCDLDGDILTGDTCEDGVCIEGDPIPCPEPFDCPGTDDANNRIDFTKKGSLLIFSKIEIQWDGEGNLIQDTFLDWTNDYPGSVWVQGYFINGDMELAQECDFPPCTPDNETQHFEPGWNTADCLFQMTGDQPHYWSAANGSDKCQPFVVLDEDGPGRPDPETMGANRILRGYAIFYAVRFNPAIGEEGGFEEIRWNHLKGDAVIVNYANGTAWEYNAWSAQARCGIQGEPLYDCILRDFEGTCCDAEVIPGRLDLDGFQYDIAFNTLLFDFYGSGSTILSGGGQPVSVNTDLTLHVVDADLRQDGNGPVLTKVEAEVWNEFESKFSGTTRCVCCWDQTLISDWSRSEIIPNHFRRSALRTDKGKARLDGVASTECDYLEICGILPRETLGSVAGIGFGDFSEDTPILGLATKFLAFSGSAVPDHATAGMNLVGVGEEAGTILVDPDSNIFQFEGLDGLETERELVRPGDSLKRPSDEGREGTRTEGSE